MSKYTQDLTKNGDYIHRTIIENKPEFKLKAFCINLEDRELNMEFIKQEWGDFLDINRFIALDNVAKSHCKLLSDIWENKDKEEFPIVVMEDDVFRKGDFTYYWNKVKEIKDVDWIAFDAMFLKFNKDPEKFHKDFLQISEHRALGFNVYYKNFFDKFETIKEIENIFKKTPIDMKFTHSKKFTKLTPKRQVVRQIVSKNSTTTSRPTNTKSYNNHIRKAQSDLLRFK